MRHRATLVSLIVLSLAITVPASAIDPFKPRVKEARAETTSKPATAKKFAKQEYALSSYKGLGTWIDMYDDVWNEPELAVTEMSLRGVSTLYLETANYHKPKNKTLFKPGMMGRFLEAAHAANMEVVSWYVPGFKNVTKDRRRIRAALRFTSSNGHMFDGFALDIEATAVRDIPKRTRRMITMIGWLRRVAGPDKALGGIVPDVQSRYWPNFPYATVSDHFDVMMPMSYFTYRVHGAKAVREYIADNFTYLRAVTGDPNLVVHNIGGIGGESTRREARAYAKTVLDHSGFGGSYYDFPITSNKEWDELQRLR